MKPLVPMKVLSWAVTGLLAMNTLWFAWDTTLITHEMSLLERLDRGEFVAESEGDASIERREASGKGLSLLLVATFVAWLVWQYRGQRNLVRAQRVGLRFRPGWVVGWWFIPFANLVKPYQTVRELWARSDPDEDRRVSPASWWVIGVWWGLWIGAFVMFAFAGGDETSTAAELLTADRWEIAGNLAYAVDALLAAWIVRGVMTRQTALAEVPAPVPARPDPGAPPPLPSF